MCRYTTLWNINVEKLATVKNWVKQAAMQDSATQNTRWKNSCAMMLALLFHHTVVLLGYLVYCVFVCLSLCLFFVLLRISQRRKKIGAWNFACVLDYNPDRFSPLLVNIGLRGRRHYFRDEWPAGSTVSEHGMGIRNWERRRCLRPYGGICVLQACWRIFFIHWCLCIGPTITQLRLVYNRIDICHYILKSESVDLLT